MRMMRAPMAWPTSWLARQMQIITVNGVPYRLGEGVFFRLRATDNYHFRHEFATHLFKDGNEGDEIFPNNVS